MVFLDPIFQTTCSGTVRNPKILMRHSNQQAKEGVISHPDYVSYPIQVEHHGHPPLLTSNSDWPVNCCLPLIIQSLDTQQLFWGDTAATENK